MSTPWYEQNNFLKYLAPVNAVLRTADTQSDRSSRVHRKVTCPSYIIRTK